MRVIGSAFGFLGRLLRGFGSIIWRFMVIFSFIVNIILVGVIVVLGVFIFNIKNDVADPLLKGLHSSFVGLDEATIDWTIPVRDSVDATFDLPLSQNTVVVLTEDVPLTVSADISGPVSITNATVALTLPEGTNLPVALDLIVPVDEVIPVNLDVRAVIPLEETQLHDPFHNLRYTFEPIILALDNLPNDVPEAITFGNQVLLGNPADLIFDEGGSPYLQQPWGGFSRTAGVGYDLLPDNQALNQSGEALAAQSAGQGGPNVVNTGIVVPGGIPFLDQFVRPELYANDGSPQAVNENAQQQLGALGVPEGSYTGDVGAIGPPPPTADPAQSASGEDGSGETVGGPNDTGAPSGEIVPGTPQPLFPEDEEN